MRRRLSALSGLTLVELLIALAVFAIVIAVLMNVWVGANRASSTTNSVAEAQQLARAAMTRIEREARAASRSSFAFDDSLGSAEVDFDSILPNDTDYSSLRYYVDDQGRLIRVEDGAERIVASNVTAFDVASATAGTAAFALTIDVNGTERTLTTEVTFRNP